MLADLATGVALDAAVSALFNQTVTLGPTGLSTVTISPDPGNVVATLNVDGVTVDIAHDAFSNNIAYTVTIPAGAVKNAGDVSNAEVSWSFTSILAAPTATTLTPEDEDTGVALDAEVGAMFNQTVTEVDLSGVTISPDPGGVVATLATDNVTVDIAHDAFSNNIAYTVTIPAGAVKNAGDVSNAEVSWSFTSVLAAPTATTLTPADLATGVALDAAVSALFNQTVTEVDLSGVTISPDPGGVVATLATDNVTVDIAHNAFSNNIAYTVIIPAGAVKNGDNVSNAQVQWSFTSILAAPTATPTPADLATGVALDAAVSALFNQTVTLGPTGLSTVTISPDPGNVVATLNVDGVTVDIAHGAFSNNTAYTVTIPAGAVKNADDVSNAEVSWSFTSVSAAPTVSGAATNAAGDTITITFNKNMANPAGKHGEFSYKVNGGTAQNFSAAVLNTDNTKLDLTCAGTAIAYGNTVTVSYTKGTVLAADGSVLESFTDQAVTNNVQQRTQQVNTATGTGIATFTTSNGSITGLTAAASTPCGTLSGFSFPQSFFSFTIGNISPGSTVTITITLPSDMPANTQYWKCINGQWVNATSLLGHNDGDNILTLTITDGSQFDADGQVNGIIVDPGGPAVQRATVPSPAAHRVSPTPPRPLNPAQLSVQYLSINPQQPSANQPVTITTNVVNTGDEAGNLNVALKINGQVEQTKMVSVGPHGTQPVKFTVTKAQPGTYTVDIPGQRGSFTINGAGGTTGKPVNGGLIAILIVGILVIVVSVLLILDLRRSAH